MTDPYKVLGVPTTATDDEVKAAYRRLAKKYHPDANPGDKVAEQRMKEINAAYDQIMNKTASGANQGYGGYSSGGYAGYDPFGRYHEALNVLSSITDRGAKWYYYSALANSGLGNTAAALEHARTAARLEPNNPQYAELLERMQTGGAYYAPFGGYGSGRVYNCSGGSSRLCLGALAAQMVCMYMRFCCR